MTSDEINEEWKSGLQGKVLINGKKVAESKRVSLTSQGSGTGEPPYYSIGETVAYISASETLVPGELIGSGTLPNLAGVENNIQLKEGDKVTLHMDPFGNLSHQIGKKENVNPNHWKSNQHSKLRNKASPSLCYTLLIYLCFFLSLIAGLLLYVPSPVDTQYWKAPKALAFEELSAPIYHVQRSINTYQLNRNETFTSPESILVRNGFMYSGIYDGSIRRSKVRARKNKQGETEFDFGIPELVARSFMWKKDGILELTNACSGTSSQFSHNTDLESRCGRVLQIQFDAKGVIYACDAVFGLLKVYSKSNEVIELNNGELASDIVVERVAPIPFANSLVIDGDNIYVTSTSKKFARNQHMYEILEGGETGSLFKYNTVTKSLEELASGLHFTNGMVMLDNALYFAETTRFRILKYDLKSKQLTTHIDNLVCIPDNLSVVKRGDKPLVWVGCAGPRLKIMEIFYAYPLFTKQLAKFEPVLDAFMKVVRKKVGFAVQYDILGTKQVTKVMKDLSGKHFYWISEFSEVTLVNSNDKEWPLQLAEAEFEDSANNYYLVGNVNPGINLSLLPPQ